MSKPHLELQYPDDAIVYIFVLTADGIKLIDRDQMLNEVERVALLTGFRDLLDTILDVS